MSIAKRATTRSELFAQMLNTMQELGMSMQPVTFDELGFPILDEVVITDTQGNNIVLKKVKKPVEKVPLGRSSFSIRKKQFRNILDILAMMGYLKSTWKVWTKSYVVVHTDQGTERIHYT